MRHGFESKMEWILRHADLDWGEEEKSKQNKNFRLWSAAAITEKHKMRNSERKDVASLVTKIKRK